MTTSDAPNELDQSESPDDLVRINHSACDFHKSFAFSQFMVANISLPKILRTSALRISCRSRRTQFSSSRFYASESAERYDPRTVERVEDEVDVCIVGAGPAGLSAAIRIKQLERERGKEVRVVVLEKGSEVGECRVSIIPGQMLILIRL